MSWEETKSKVDAVVSAIIGSVLAFSIMLGSGFLCFESAPVCPVWIKLLCAVFFAWSLVTEGWFVWMSWWILVQNQHPSAVALALKQPRVPHLLRPPLALWWAFQFLMALAWGVGLALVTGKLPLAADLFVATALSGFAYLTFGYLLLAITAISRRQSVVARIWKWRGRWAAAQGFLFLALKVFVAPHLDPQ